MLGVDQKTKEKDRTTGLQDYSMPKIKIFTCGICEDYFTKHSGHYKRHVTRCRISHNSGSEMCDLCDFKASSIRELERHKIRSPPHQYSPASV